MLISTRCKTKFPFRSISGSWLGIFILLFCGQIQAADVVQHGSGGAINWTQGFVTSVGMGTAADRLNPAQKKILSRRAAVVDAQRNLLEMVKGVRVTSMTKVVDAMQESDVIATRVEGVVKGAVIISEQFEEGIFKVEMKMPLGGTLMSTVYGGVRQQEVARYQILSRDPQALTQHMGRVLDAALSFVIPSAYATPFVIKDEQEAQTALRLLKWLEANQTKDLKIELENSVANFEQGRFSGLLIDARGVPGFELATVPKIRDPNGDVIYPNVNTSYSDIVNKRGVSYDFDMDDAIKNERVSEVPLVIKALDTYGNLPSDLIIASADISKIQQSVSISNAMNKAGVLIVVSL